MRWIAVSLIAASAAALPALAAEDMTLDKRADVRQLVLTTLGSRVAAELADATMRNATPAVRRARPDVAERLLAVINRELTTLFEERIDAPGGLIDHLIAAYGRHFTHAEAKELLAFYRTSLGRKALELVPLASTESVAWAQKLSPEVRQRIDAALRREGLQPLRTK